MSDPFWPWWAVITFFLSGAVSGALVLPVYVRCPNCYRRVRTHLLHDHQKECLS